jgi:hypothetical protein
MPRPRMRTRPRIGVCVGWLSFSGLGDLAYGGAPSPLWCTYKTHTVTGDLEPRTLAYRANAKAKDHRPARPQAAWPGS